MWPAILIFGAWTLLDLGLEAVTGKDSVDLILDWAGIGGTVTESGDLIINSGSTFIDFVAAYSVELVALTFIVLLGAFVATRPFKKGAR